jgi:hypothetical protein
MAVVLGRRSRFGYRSGLIAGLLAAVAGCGSEPDGSGKPGVPTASGQSRTVAPPNPAGKPTSRGLVGDRLANAVYLPVNPTIPQEPSPFRFTDLLPTSGVDFVQYSGMDQDKHFPTANGSGLAVFDYDGDGKMDLYFCTYQHLKPEVPRRGSNRLYRNLGDGRFEDVTEKAGVGYVGCCHGAMAGDIDNDGDQDLFLANYGPNVLYLNNGDGTFTDISQQAGIHRPGWSSGGAFLDYDDDGDLDMYVSNYGDWKLPDDDKFCGDAESGLRLYCSPREVRTVQHFFYRNNGDHTFTDVAEEVGVARAPGQRGHGFGVVAADLNDDGKIDLYVANDMNPNFLFLNKGDGTFHDATEESGAAYDDKGNAQSGMGVDAEDIDGDGRPELFVTNFANEYNTLYQNLGNGTFFDQTPAYGLAADAMPWVGWGCGLVDLDNDGWPDAFVANGHVDDNRAGVDYAEPPLLHRNVPLGEAADASRRFKLSTRDVGPYFSSKHVARGAAFGDLNDDGKLDIVVNHKDAPPAILRNDTPGDNGWIRLKLVGTRSNRDAIGTRVAVVAGGRTIHRQRKGGTSLESSHDPRLLIGIGTAPEAESITIHWPSGAESKLEHVAAGSTHEVVEPKVPGVAAAG